MNSGNFPLLYDLWCVFDQKNESLEELCKNLENVEFQTLEFFLPQIINKEKIQDNPLCRFLLKVCSKSFHFGLLMRLFLESEGEKCKNLICLVDNAIVKKKEKFTKKPKNKEKERKSFSKAILGEKFRKRIFREKVSNFYSNQLYFFEFLINLGKKMFFIPYGIYRKNKLKIELFNFNKGLPVIYYPICSTKDNFCQIVRICYEESIVFSTKARVPYLIYLECLEQDFDCSTPFEKLFKSRFSSPNVVDCNIEENVIVEEKFEKEKKLSYFNVKEDFVIISKSLSNKKQEEVENEKRAEILDTVFGVGWEKREKLFRMKSPFGHLRNWKLKSFIVKTFDDLRQEHMCMQVIRIFNHIWVKENKLPIKLNPYSFIITGESSGLVETLKDSVSLDSLMKKFKGFKSLLDYFTTVYGDVDSKTFKTAQTNFIESMAANSVICYLLQVKDRHNGNIMIHRNGGISHIDFGFLLGISPKNIGFETAPFKLTKSFIEVIGGNKINPIESDSFKYFRMLIYCCFDAAVKNSKRIINVIETLFPLSKNYPCLKNSNFKKVLERLKERFLVGIFNPDIEEISKKIITSSMEDNRTKKYDQFQYISQGIMYE